jgi:hypothetical protein
VNEAVQLLDPATRRSHGDIVSVPGRPSGTTAIAERVANRLEWRIRCNDALDRERCLTVVVDNGQVLVVGPPGETAVLSPGQLGQFRTALLEAAEQAER